MPYIGHRPTAEGEAVGDDSIVVPTSGSGGQQRLVRLTHGNIEAAVEASQRRLGNTAADRWLLCLPLNHVGGLSIVWRSLRAGGSVAMAPFDERLPAFIAGARPTVASMVPTMVTRAVDATPDVLASMRFVLVGGGPIAPRIVERTNKQGIALVATYGMTEAASQIATGSIDEPRRLMALDHMEVSIRDIRDSGTGVGRIAIAGPNVSPGYLGSPDRQGPFVTNDLGSVDHDGALTVLGRVDDIVITGGENVSLSAVGAAVASFAGVSAATAVGLPDPEWGTAVVAVVATPLDHAQLASIAKQELAPHERPRRWITVDVLPMLPNGKPDMAAALALAHRR
jgi:O-succinylbenzoic acid--CoA ligase